VSRTPSHLTRLALIAAASAAFLAAAPALAQQDHHHEGGGGHEGRDGGGGGGGGREHWAPGDQQRGGGPWARGPSPGGMAAPSPGPRYQRPYSGYPAAPRYYPAPTPRPSYQAPYRARWLRGGYLPPSYQSYVISEYWRFNLRRPPYGYEWVQVGPEYLLVSVSTGMIFDVVPAD
jgi:Ni/Co efflux regulator RcnB